MKSESLRHRVSARVASMRPNQIVASLILFNIFVYVLASGIFTDGWIALLVATDLNENFMLSSDGFWHRPWTFLTHAFMHGSIVHLALNMFGIRALYRLTEGKHFKDMALAYGLGLVSSALFIVTFPNSEGLATVGASGALFALLGLMATSPFFMRYRFAIWITVAINAGITLLIPFISWQAHLGGFLAGALLGIVIGVRNSAGTDEFLDLSLEFEEAWPMEKDEAERLIAAMRETYPVKRGNFSSALATMETLTSLIGKDVQVVAPWQNRGM